MQSSLVRMAAAKAGKEAFFAPRTSISPFKGFPPCMMNRSIISPHATWNPCVLQLDKTAK